MNLARTATTLAAQICILFLSRARAGVDPKVFLPPQVFAPDCTTLHHFAVILKRGHTRSVSAMASQARSHWLVGHGRETIVPLTTAWGWPSATNWRS